MSERAAFHLTSMHTTLDPEAGTNEFTLMKQTHAENRSILLKTQEDEEEEYMCTNDTLKIVITKIILKIFIIKI